MGVLACKALEDPQKLVSLSTRFPKPISLLLGQYRRWIAENIIATVADSSQLEKNDELMHQKLGLEHRAWAIIGAERYRRR